ncbi:MAG: NAD(P)-dependent oxidoreductase [Micavibrio aeruginosavorus]|uniref:NAD(P)-dependent oxidoreductase n=1 Tax=Micavibrio aeruginosavorus TaxID=349221 RepID=A0A2W5A2U6_9BACT|nr:MAG: NAD(P)-dependent oxidoreductase [Micavibrio aeruginosavorus]
MSDAYARHTPKTVFITGATGDFGKAFVQRFAASGGCNLILHGRDEKKVGALCAGLPSALPLVFDITDKDAMKKAIDGLPETHKNIDLLINNAGLALGLDRGHEASIDDWETMIDVNVTALVRMTRLIAEGMAERKGGHIINIGSTAGNYPYRGGSVYCATKAFVKQFSLSLRADFAGLGIRVTNLEPAQVETQFSAVRFKGDSTRADAVYAGTQSLQAEDIAETVFWAATLPPHVNINRMEVMATTQYPAGLAFERKGN